MDHAAQLLLAYKGVVVAAWFAAFFLAERLRPAAPLPAGLPRPSWARGRWSSGAWARVGRNLTLFAVNFALSPLIVVPVSAWAAQQALVARPAWWGGWPGLLADLLILDALIYWWHRANHRWPPLWRFHQVHHLDRFLDSTSALRFHFGEVLLSALARAAVIVLLAVPLVSVVVFETLLLCATIFHHSNLRLPARLEAALARLVVTPSIHWVHHHARRADTDSNYATVLSLWDRLFGSRSPTRRRPDMAIGVEGAPELPLPALVVRPFRPGDR
jgi:sterol desaturase/sphingolipid hydroxylase (fatty acid hydroxylase superfamily)